MSITAIYTFLSLISAYIFYLSLNNSKKDMFYSDTFFLMPFGIYVWGDGLVLAPFWFVASIIFWFLSIKQVVVFLLVFWVIRSGFEVIYWLNHQSVNNDFNPPMLRKVKWLDAGKSAILYQLLHTTIIILGVIGILFTK